MYPNLVTRKNTYLRDRFRMTAYSDLVRCISLIKTLGKNLKARIGLSELLTITNLSCSFFPNLHTEAVVSYTQQQ